MSDLDKLRSELKSLDDAIIEAEDTDDTGEGVEKLKCEQLVVWKKLNALEKAALREMKKIE